MAMAAHLEHVGPVHQLVMVRLYLSPGGYSGIEAALESCRLYHIYGCGKDHGPSGLDLHLELPWDVKVLPAVESAAVLVGVSHSLVPVGIRPEHRRGTAHLEVKVREALVHVERDTARDLLVVKPGLGILDGKGMDIPECQERLEHQRNGSGRLKDLEFNKHLVAVLHELYALPEKDAPDPVGDLGDRVSLEIHYVLVAAGLIYVSVAVDSEIELLAPKDKAFVK